MSKSKCIKPVDNRCFAIGGRKVNIEKASKLFERLRQRTESRGATPAEAAQAADLADKIARRYGLSDSGSANTTYRMHDKRLPGWCAVLLCAINKRFGIGGYYVTETGKPVELVFKGPPHKTGIALWLFEAIRNDLDKRSFVAGRAMGLKGGAFVKFRNRFRRSASLEIDSRLNPPREVARETKTVSKAKPSNKGNRKTKAWSQEELQAAMNAQKFGREAGQQIKLDTNVIGRNGEPLKIEQRCGAPQ